MTRAALPLLALASCATYSDPIPGVRYPADPPKLLFNRCDRGRLPQAVEVVVAVRDAARDLMLLAHWPPVEPMVLCVVTDRPWVACAGAGRHLAGCTDADGRQVLVSVAWSPAGDWRLDPHDWRGTMVHEVIAAGALGGWLALPRPSAATESAWVQGEAYRSLMAAARKRLNR